MNTANTSTELFRASWSLYDEIIAQNYMFHREISVSVGHVMSRLAARGGYTVLDLGCGNARTMAAAMKVATPRSYWGVDLSRPALNEAKTLLRDLPAVRLIEQEMLEAVCELAAQCQAFDLIHSSFAMHHLDWAAKARLFRAMAAALAPGGAVVLVDIVRGANQSRMEYLESYLGTVEREWKTLGADQVQQVRDHVTSFDFPETQAELSRMALNAGLSECRVLGEFGEHQVLHFEKGATGSNL